MLSCWMIKPLILWRYNLQISSSPLRSSTGRLPAWKANPRLLSLWAVVWLADNLKCFLEFRFCAGKKCICLEISCVGRKNLHYFCFVLFPFDPIPAYGLSSLDFTITPFGHILLVGTPLDEWSAQSPSNYNCILSELLPLICTCQIV